MRTYRNIMGKHVDKQSNKQGHKPGNRQAGMQGNKQGSAQGSRQGNPQGNKQGKLKIIPLGGLGEVGKNMTAYEFGGQILIVDAGIMFPENDMLGIDYIIPDYTYVRERADKVVGIIITHGHEDHIGAIAHVVHDIPAPVYATPL